MLARFCVLVCLLTLTTACASFPPLPGESFTEPKAAPDGMARIYVYRPGYLQLIYAETGIYVDDELRLILTNDSYGTFTLTPGTHRFMARLTTEKLADEHEALHEPIAFDYEVAAGQTYYLAWRPVNRTIGDGYYLAGAIHDESAAVANNAGASEASIRTGATLGVVGHDNALKEITETGRSRSGQR
ncbi:DUF2846 domain-containing protein [Granulosicoccaceae sp. 1_MG-2023]|nr:DUF2846 domain-containing protein [Granulosicoccaceae sp. 1_MG-2023]